MITVENEQKFVEVGEDLIKAIEETIEFTLEDQRVSYEGEVSVLLVDNETIQEINRENRNIDKPTDVLSFPMIDYEEGKTFTDLYADHDFGVEYFDGDALVLGDIVISMEKAAEQAMEYGHSLKREVCYLTVHSVLHLLGYEHMNDEEKQVMRGTEERILNELKITRDLEG
ncbi:rRNA maturation RNase YbeY [Proteiniclasticum sp.]|uniref:rRNA maturation RNase YbeY n=1 Tax=Proteiniclasticum sp. TaxID=2053595 RepID=UPI0028A26EAB|nr:rRNA maturation RNase YbeY [Proteiniclasticum sp.]